MTVRTWLDHRVWDIYKQELALGGIRKQDNVYAAMAAYLNKMMPLAEKMIAGDNLQPTLAVFRKHPSREMAFLINEAVCSSFLPLLAGPHLPAWLCRHYVWASPDLVRDVAGHAAPKVEFWGSEFPFNTICYVDLTGSRVEFGGAMFVRALAVSYLNDDNGVPLIDFNIVFESAEEPNNFSYGFCHPLNDGDITVLGFEAIDPAEGKVFRQRLIDLFKNVWLYYQSAGRSVPKVTPLQPYLAMDRILRTHRTDKRMRRGRDFSLFNMVPLVPSNRLVPSDQRTGATLTCGINLTVRFDVRGHFRWQAKGEGSRKDPSKRTHELIWVNAFEKGPKDAPKKLTIVAVTPE